MVKDKETRASAQGASKAGKGSKYNKTSETNEYAGKITHKIFRGASVYYDVTIGDNTTVQVRSTQSKLKVGQNLKVTIAKQDALIVQGAS